MASASEADREADHGAGRERGFEFGNDGPSVILVGVDGSPTSLRAGAYAMGLARRQRSRIVVVYVVNAPAMAGLAPQASNAVEESLQEAAREMGERVAEAAGYHAHPLEYRAVRGDPYTELIRAATELRADAVVVGASTRAGHRLVGSLAVRLVRAGRWPVTVVP